MERDLIRCLEELKRLAQAQESTKTLIENQLANIEDKIMAKLTSSISALVENEATKHLPKP